MSAKKKNMNNQEGPSELRAGGESLCVATSATTASVETEAATCSHLSGTADSLLYITTTQATKKVPKIILTRIEDIQATTTTGDNMDTDYQPQTSDPSKGSEENTEEAQLSRVADRTRSATKTLAGKMWSQRKRVATEELGEDTTSDDGSVRSRSNCSKRGRASPANSLDRLTTKPVQQRRKEFLLQGEKSEESHTELEGNSSSSDERSADTLLTEALRAAEAVRDIAKKSTNIKGNLRHELKVASNSFKKIARVLSRRTTSEEVKRLQAENNRLRRELDEIRKDFSAIREEIGQSKRTPSREEGTPRNQKSVVPTVSTMEEFQRMIMV